MEDFIFQRWELLDSACHQLVLVRTYATPPSRGAIRVLYAQLWGMRRGRYDIPEARSEKVMLLPPRTLGTLILRTQVPPREEGQGTWRQ